MRWDKSILSRRIWVSLLGGVLLGCTTYLPVAEAGQQIIIADQSAFDNADSNIKDSDGHIKPNDLDSNTVIIGSFGGGENPIISGGGYYRNVYGACVQTSDNVSGNTINVYSGKMNWLVGGYSKKGTVVNNKVNISGGTLTGGIIGGESDSGNVKNNIVKADNIIINNDINGGYTNSGDAKNNEVTISNATANYIQGGYTGTGSADGNRIVINGGKVKYSTLGGYVNDGNGSANNNIVVINGGDLATESQGGTYYSIAGGMVGTGISTASNNEVYINGGTIYGSVTGGNSDSGAAADNIVVMSGGTVQGVIAGGKSYSGTAENNILMIKGGTVEDVAYGAFNGMTGNAVNNKVFISGGKINSNVYGGFTMNNYGSDNSLATGNIITISGNPEFGTNTNLLGGYVNSNSNGNAFTGNTLNIQTKDVRLKNVGSFEYYNFDPQGITSANNVLLTLTDSSGTDLSGSKIAVYGRLQGTVNIFNNDKIVLLTNTNGMIITDAKTELQSGEIMQGVSVVYDYTAKMSDDNKQVLAEFTNGRISANSQSPVETKLAAAAFLNSGADMVTDKGIANAVQMAGGTTAEMFGAMSGGSMRYKSGSYADVHGYNMALGLAKAVTNNAGKLTYGPLLEYGWGNYTSHLDSGIRADGNTKYYGIGLLARQDNNDGVYYEGSLRYGRMDADYASGDLIGAGGSKVFADYDSSSSYYGAHLGIGKVNKINDTTKADLYAKLFYTHQGGDSVTLGGEGNGEVYDFDAVDSTRARVGARLSKAYGERSSGYVGLAYEYEFDGEARATVKGLSTPAPSIKGSSGLLEVGYILQPKGVNDPMINIGLQGWGGKKQGVSGSVNFVWKF